MTDKEDTLENRARLFFHQGELFAEAVNAIFDMRKTENMKKKIDNMTKKKIVQG